MVWARFGSVKFGLLGRFSVGHADEERDLGPPQRRAVLAVLACSPNRVVSTDRLIDSVWGEDGSRQALAGLQAHISRLRKLLGSDRITTQPGGYVLRVEPDELDVEVFHRLAAEGRQAIQEGSDLAGSRLLEAALALWRGEPLAEFAYADWAQTEIGRLNELKLGVIEDWNDSQLRLGHHREVIPQLELLASQHPFREQLQRALMLALYRAGRQAEALRVAARTRARLAEELGIDASEELQVLELQILEHAPDLSITSPTLTRRPELSVSSNIPAVLTSFLGREREFDEVVALLSRHRFVTIVGQGGAGKTRLAFECARRIHASHGVRTWAIELADVDNPEIVVGVIAAQLGATEGGGEPLSRVLSVLAGTESLVVLDNCEQVVDAVATLVHQVLRSATSVTFLATSRESIGIPGEHLYRLDGLDLKARESEPSDAASLFIERARDLGVEELETGGVDRICTIVEGWPLAIELAAGQTPHMSLMEIEEQLNTDISMFSTPYRMVDERHRTLAATLDWSLRLLPERLQVVFRALGQFEGSFSADSGVAVASAS